MPHWPCPAEADNHMGNGVQQKQQAIQRILKGVDSGEDRMSVSHKLLDESDESLPDHDVAGVEQGGGGEPPGRGSGS